MLPSFLHLAQSILMAVFSDFICGETQFALIVFDFIRNRSPSLITPTDVKRGTHGTAKLTAVLY